MFTAYDFINIHTHSKPKIKNEQVIRNAFLSLSGDQLTNFSYHTSVGLHPWHINKMSLNECGDKLIDLSSNNKVLAIGEIGIDRAVSTPIKTQLDYFDVQLNVARALQKPVIIHAVKSYGDIIPFLKKTKIPFIFHGFNGNEQQAKELLKYNCKLSFGKNVFEDKAQNVLRILPENSFLLETDASTKLNIDDIYRKVADIKALDIDELKSKLFHTFATIMNTF